MADASLAAHQSPELHDGAFVQQDGRNFQKSPSQEDRQQSAAARPRGAAFCARLSLPVNRPEPLIGIARLCQLELRQRPGT